MNPLQRVQVLEGARLGGGLDGEERRQLLPHHLPQSQGLGANRGAKGIGNIVSTCALSKAECTWGEDGRVVF